MAYITTSVIVIITLAQSASPSSYKVPFIKSNTRTIVLKQGLLQGIVVEPTQYEILPPVVQYLGIPYAAPPVGELRFMPSGSAPSWFGTKYANTFGPVCPQQFPDPATMVPERRDYFLRLKQYLENQSEDCLYLNIYAPFQEPVNNARKYPVMVYIHGESFEWNSGNPYDGSVLAAYGKVIVVTLNFRLGIMGFLKASMGERSKSNFGLVDQVAALVWVKDNIAAFGGDPKAVTLFGHGTGAVCASLLMLSPMVHQENNKTLFQRAILMGGTALADWALAGNPREVSYQVAQALNCQIHDDFAACLRRKSLEDIMAAAVAVTPAYRTRFGPVIDNLVILHEPRESMTISTDLFRRFELMYGVTELESIHLLGPVALIHGMLEKEREQELRKYLRHKCERKPELCVSRTLAEYTGYEFTENDEKYGDYTGHEPDKAVLVRDALLDILSDARTVAPTVQTAKHHAALNLQSYFYVFTHKTQSREYIFVLMPQRNKSFNGEELPYVFGVPLDGPKFHFTDQYTEKERLFSEIIMTYFSNFAYNANPNVPRKNEFYTLNPLDWIQFDVDWPEFDLKQQRFLQLAIPPHVLHHYRHKETTFWNEVFPGIANKTTLDPIIFKHQPQKTQNNILMKPIKGIPPWILVPPGRKSMIINKYENFDKPLATTKTTFYGTVVTATNVPNNIVNNENGYGTVITSPPETNKGSLTITIIVIAVLLFLLANLLLFLGIYYKCCKMKKNREVPKNDENAETTETEKHTKLDEEALVGGCNLIKIIGKSSKNNETYEPVKTQSSKYKLARQMSNSTIDAHTKVRDWITQEIVHKYSPRFLRKSKRYNKSMDKKNSTETEHLHDFKIDTSNSPTRPVSPNANQRPPLMKSATIPKAKPAKVSVAVDATPAGRGPSVLKQQPIEVTKSLDRPNFETPLNLRRSSTLEDFTRISPKCELRKSTTSINLNWKLSSLEEPTIIRIEHGYSKSEPVQDLYSTAFRKKLKTFDPSYDVNVTSRDENISVIPLTPEESLMTIKRRNFPKVLPDYPTREALVNKRRSMPVSSLFSPIPETSQLPTTKLLKYPPVPPPRSTSTLTRQASTQSDPICQSAPMLAEEPPTTPEPEITCNNLYVGPLIPKLSSSDSSKLNIQPIYESLRAVAKPVPDQPKKIEPRVIIKPTTTMTRQASDPKHKNIPRVVVSDNLPQIDGVKEDVKSKGKKSQIPTLVKGSAKNSSSSESTPTSEESDTGTVVKRI